MQRTIGLMIWAVMLSLASQTASKPISFVFSDVEFLEDARYKVGSDPSGLYAADLDGDYDLDLVAANKLGNNVTVLLNTGDGTYTFSKNYTTQWPSGIAGADLDKDGDLELMVTSMQANRVILLVNQGDGTFKTGKTYSVGSKPLCIALADLDGDGDMDCVVGGAGGLSVLLNDGSGAFFCRRKLRHSPVGYGHLCCRSGRRPGCGRSYGERGR